MKRTEVRVQSSQIGVGIGIGIGIEGVRSQEVRDGIKCPISNAQCPIPKFTVQGSRIEIGTEIGIGIGPISFPCINSFNSFNS
jgi:hypothetical protein